MGAIILPSFLGGMISQINNDLWLFLTSIYEIKKSAQPGRRSPPTCNSQVVMAFRFMYCWLVEAQGWIRRSLNTGHNFVLLFISAAWPVCVSAPSKPHPSIDNNSYIEFVYRGKSSAASPFYL